MATSMIRPLLAALSVAAFGCIAAIAEDQLTDEAVVGGASPQICFRPGFISCTALIVKEIDSAAHTIDFEAYSLTDIQIIDALKRAVSRGVAVRSVVDRNSTMAKLLPGEVKTDCTVRIMHNKVVIVDGESVGLGSFNFTFSAEHNNAENHLWLHDKYIAVAYSKNFEVLFGVSKGGVGCP